MAIDNNNTLLNPKGKFVTIIGKYKYVAKHKYVIYYI